jgi:isopentenyl diphosphate isomerase/L-lactate dehydrogenase-like FMN-dependent dehydrogenase
VVQEHHEKYGTHLHSISSSPINMFHFLPVPLVLKGVQCWEDALQAYDAGLAGVVLSNHGGRQMDFSRSGIEVLAEVVI